MQVNFEWSGIEKDDKAEEWAVEQFAKLDRYLNSYAEDFKQLWLRVGKENGFTYRVSMELKLPTKHEYFHEEGEDLRSVLDSLSEKADRWVRKHREKLGDKR